MAPSTAHQAGLPDNLKTEEVLDLIFRDPQVKHGLSEFDDLGKKPHEILKLYPKTVEKAYAAEREASNLLEQAKRRVEELVEQEAG